MVSELAMRKNGFLVVIGVFFIFLAFAQAQGQCQPWHGEPALCAEIFQTNVTNVWTVLPQSALAALSYNYTLQLLPLKSLAKGCYLRSLWLLCNGYFPPCTASNITNPSYFEQLTCNTVCQETNAYCAGITEPQNCAQLNPFKGTPAFPNSTFPVTYNNITYTLPCITPPQSYLSQNYSLNCEGPLAPSPLKDGTCALRCPAKFFTNSEWHAIQIVLQCLGWISLVCAVVVLLPFLTIRERRRAPAIAQTFTIIAITPISLGVAMMSFSSGDIICENAAKLADRKNAACVIQASFIHFGTESGMFWAMWLMFDCLVFVMTRRRELIRHWLYYQIALSTVIPLILVIIALATKSYGASYNMNFCFISGSNSASVFKGYDSYLFWMPLAILWILAVATWAVLFVMLVRTTSPRVSGVWLAIRTQIRLLVFVGYFSIAIGLLFLYRFTQKPKFASFSTAFADFVVCWAAKVAGAPVVCGKTPHPRSNYLFDFVSLALVFAVPCSFCLCMGAVPDVWNFYSKLWRLVSTRAFAIEEWKTLTERSTRSKESSSSSSSSGSQADDTVHTSTTDTGQQTLSGDEGRFSNINA